MFYFSSLFSLTNTNNKNQKLDYSFEIPVMREKKELLLIENKN
jgi:hypothetical protein